jgi:hypothetical protein
VRTILRGVPPSSSPSMPSRACIQGL